MCLFKPLRRKSMLIEVSWLFLFTSFALAYYVLQYHSGVLDTEKEEHERAWWQSPRRRSIRVIYVCLFFSGMFMLLHFVVPQATTKTHEHDSNSTLPT